tara:strand:- start:286 stop:498 length:213 start_codon:yes stop_codon:yes gene_type:complete
MQSSRAIKRPAKTDETCIYSLKKETSFMAKYTNVVRFKAKPGKKQEFESLFSKADKWEGQLLHILARTGE